MLLVVVVLALGPSPGPLAGVHAALDTPVGCNDCHDGTKETPADKCVHCHDHERLRARLAAGMGFHASPLVLPSEAGEVALMS